MIEIGKKCVSGKISAASTTVLPTNVDVCVALNPRVIKAPSSNSKGSVNSALLITILISLDVRSSGETNSLIPKFEKSIFSFSKSSGLDILAIVFFAPNCFAR